MFYRLLFTIFLSFLISTTIVSAADLSTSKGTDQPTILKLTPEPGSTVSTDTAIGAQFSVELDAKHLNRNSVKLRCLSCKKKRKVRGNVTYIKSQKKVVFIPQRSLEPGIYEIEYKNLKTKNRHCRVKRKGHHDDDIDAGDDRKSTNIRRIKYRFEVIPVVLESINLSPSSASLVEGESLSLNVDGSYSDGTTETLSDDLEWIVSDTNVVSVDAYGQVSALHEGHATIKVKKGSILSNEISIEVKPPVVLESLTIAPNPLTLRVGGTLQINVMGHYSNGSTKTLSIDDGLDYTISDYDIATITAAGELEGLAEGTTTIQVSVGSISSLTVDITIAPEIKTDNFNFTNFGNQYLDQIPVDATKTNYDENRFCMIAGKILTEDGSPLAGVKVSIHQHPEYGTTTTNKEGLYAIPAEGGPKLTMRYSKEGYTTIDRIVQTPMQDWVRAEDVTMLQEDSKVTTIDLSNPAAQTHISTPITDDRGTRSTTLVFDGVTSATVTSQDGSSKQLTTFDVRATEFKTPESMPADLPKESAYTYCSDLKIDGTSDTDEITFNAPVVMYVDNFLEFPVGAIVPVGYYDRNQGQWIGSDNGAVVALLDTDNDGKIDALDSTGDGQPNDLNGNGSVSDEVAGIADNPNYVAGKSYWRAAFTHFTPWDHNWPYAPPQDAQEPDPNDPTSDDDQPNDCKTNVSSYVTGKSRVFHEDIPVAGTNITLHYSSKRVDGYKHIIDASTDTSTMPNSVAGARVTLKVAGKSYTKYPDLSELEHLRFIWDGKDALGRKVTGEIIATVEYAYRYQLVYMSATSAWSQAWARAGSSSFGIVSRKAIEYTSTRTIRINAEASNQTNSAIAKGWTLSNVHDIGANAVYKGDGTQVDKGADLSKGLIAYYKFDGNIKDSSYNRHDSRASGTMTYVDGVQGKALHFDGLSHIELDPFKDEDIQRGITYAYWFKSSNLGIQAILTQYSYVKGRLFYNGISNSIFNIRYYHNLEGGDTTDYVDASYSDPEKWHHLLVNVTEKTIQAWVDGKLVGENTRNILPYATKSSVQTYIGNTGPMGTGSDKHFRGELDDLRVYNKELSPAEIQNIYSYGKDGITNMSLDSTFISDNTLGYQFALDGKHLTTKTYPDKKILETYTYDEEGYLVAITDRFGQITTITRDGNGNPVYITAPNGQKTYLNVDEQGNLTEVGYEDSSSYNFTYFEGSLMDIMTDPNGNRIQHFFDENGRIIEEIDGEGGSYKFQRELDGKDTIYSKVQPEGETMSSKDTVLSNGDTQSHITLASGDTMSATFSKDKKHVESSKDGISSVATYIEDKLTHQMIPLSQITTQPSGLKNIINYATNYEGNKTHTDTKTQSMTNNGKTTTVRTDYNNGISTVTTPEGRTATKEYDIDTRLTSSITVGTLTPTTFTYDTKGRVTKEATGSRETLYSYDPKGNMATITDPRGKVTRYGYDVMDQVTTVTYPDGTTEQFSYDFNGNLLTRTVPTPADHSFTYNGVDKATSYTSPLQKSTTYTYDKNRRVTQVTRPSGKTINNTYDKGRLVSTTTPEGTTNYSYLFANKVGSITNGSESFTYGYDGDLLTSITQSGVLKQAINFTYNNDFAVTSTTYAGTTESYSYDKDGLPTKSGNYTLTRDAQNGYVTQLSDGTLTQSRSYNSYGELTQLSDNTFTYQLPQRDNGGAITRKVETINGVSVTYDYTYDDLGRLIEVKKDGSVVEEYSYDANGNRVSATINGTTTTASYTLDDQLEVYGDNSYRYDDDGYLSEKTTPDGTTTYSYGTMGELKEVQTPTQTITYQHNALNQRTAKLVNGTVVEKYLWADLTTLLAVYDKDDNLVQRFEYADQRMPVSMTSNGQKYYLHYDQVGSLRAVSDTSHNVIKKITYDTYGNVLSDSNPSFKVPFGFAGGLYDSDTGLTRFGYRDYDAYTGKWTAKDPIGFDGGDTNLYGYVLGDPVNLTDEDGLSASAVARTGRLGLALTLAASDGPLPFGDLAALAILGFEYYYLTSDEDTSDDEGESCPTTKPEKWEKIPGSDQAYAPKGKKEPVFERDRLRDNAHGGSYWKKWNKRRNWEKGKLRDGTYDKNGRRLRG